MKKHKLTRFKLADPTPGCPSASFRSLQDGCFLIRASTEAFVRCVKQDNPNRLLSEADCRYAPLSENQTEAWLAAIPMCSSVALDGDELSEKLDTRVVQMVYDSNTDVRVARIWDQGVCVEYLALESTEFDEFRDPDVPNHLSKKPKSNHSVVTKDEDSEVRITFQSTLVKLPENALQVGPKLLDQRFRELGIPFFPALFQD